MRILVVEDEYKIANSVKKGLEQEGYAVDVVYDGNEGYDMASAEEYDVIILDLMLPGLDGVTLCKKLREDRNHTPILMLTAKGQTSDKVDGLNAGADDYLVKPFAFEELLARIRALTRRPVNGGQTILKVGDLELDTTAYEVKRVGKSVNLTRREFALLEYLMRNPGKIMTKDQIIAHVWDYDADVLPNTVEVYVGYLRRKIDNVFPKEKPIIHTVRGFGYKLGQNSNVKS
ncbi:DNA-binding response regulator [Candidatus Woesebacteria bacterium RIFCSPHIGHO2_01_FULL_39_32]|uniref:Two component transcriptional regulator, winged helix family n=2 Tax=Candidatus Woeseibacteriota TaxID=1752722 RepID=A0A0G0PS88_9BACT|nr:MAG: Two component transcriptional regulator, winged helix family [Candidatus Woesebacteria bacterium GW2011_GWA1_39_8]OGM03443.1 MAG: DNA-binding response regulator [Candidatus Woesebacteria bacterium GWB1_37_5]OGM23939.1 MAG: DNA-binding response regulator [Candidatus Woesebacteria bacterium RIFCSPHIGHO2_01_FULL_39_32]OGM37445.1 MAG: DNA-binding response regulator [Candidatus Woesebacteria bacterium RIFCSPHIGHO2_12_FULL_38_11]OGM64128.1 MAG: DNA-binding response regulator [Candidatus Woese